MASQGRACNTELWVAISRCAVRASPCDAISISELAPAQVKVGGAIRGTLHHHKESSDRRRHHADGL